MISQCHTLDIGLSQINFGYAHVGMVTISPSGAAPVCFGGQLELMCTTSLTGRFLQWSFSLIRGSDTTPTDFVHTMFMLILL